MGKQSRKQQRREPGQKQAQESPRLASSDDLAAMRAWYLQWRESQGAESIYGLDDDSGQAAVARGCELLDMPIVFDTAKDGQVLMDHSRVDDRAVYDVGQQDRTHFECPLCGVEQATCVLCRTAGHFKRVEYHRRGEGFRLCVECGAALTVYSEEARDSLFTAAVRSYVPLRDFITGDSVNGPWRWEDREDEPPGEHLTRAASALLRAPTCTPEERERALAILREARGG